MCAESMISFVMPAEAGIQGKCALVALDPGFRRGDGWGQSGRIQL